MVFYESWRKESKRQMFTSVSPDFFIKCNTDLQYAFRNRTGSIFLCLILLFQTFISSFVYLFWLFFCILTLMHLCLLVTPSQLWHPQLSLIQHLFHSFPAGHWPAASHSGPPPPSNARFMWWNVYKMFMWRCNTFIFNVFLNLILDVLLQNISVAGDILVMHETLFMLSC